MSCCAPAVSAVFGNCTPSAKPAWLSAASEVAPLIALEGLDAVKNPEPLFKNKRCIVAPLKLGPCDVCNTSKSPSRSTSAKSQAADQSAKPPPPRTSDGATDDPAPPKPTNRFESNKKFPGVPPCNPPWFTNQTFDCVKNCVVFAKSKSRSPSWSMSKASVPIADDVKTGKLTAVASLKTNAPPAVEALL